MMPDDVDQGPWRDEIVEEIRGIRRKQAAQFDYDVRAIIDDARKRQEEGGRKVVSLPPRRPQLFNEPAG